MAWDVKTDRRGVNRGQFMKGKGQWEGGRVLLAIAGIIPAEFGRELQRGGLSIQKKN